MFLGTQQNLFHNFLTPMRIGINFQSLAQKLKHKAISNSLRKGKMNSPTWPTTTRTQPTCAQRAREGTARRSGPRTQADPRWKTTHELALLQRRPYAT